MPAHCKSQVPLLPIALPAHSIASHLCLSRGPSHWILLSRFIHRLCAARLRDLCPRPELSKLRNRITRQNSITLATSHPKLHSRAFHVHGSDFAHTRNTTPQDCRFQRICIKWSCAASSRVILSFFGQISLTEQGAIALPPSLSIQPRSIMKLVASCINVAAMEPHQPSATRHNRQNHFNHTCDHLNPCPSTTPTRCLKHMRGEKATNIP